MTTGALAAALAGIPYARFLGVEAVAGTDDTAILRSSRHLIGNPMLPALHGGSVAGFMELTAIATLMAEMGLPEAVRKDMMGHTEIRTTQQYTHLSARAQVQPHEAIAAHLPLKAVLLAKPRPKELGGKLGKTKRTPLHFRPQTNTSRTA